MNAATIEQAAHSVATNRAGGVTIRNMRPCVIFEGLHHGDLYRDDQHVADVEHWQHDPTSATGEPAWVARWRENKRASLVCRDRASLVAAAIANLRKR